MANRRETLTRADWISLRRQSAALRRRVEALIESAETASGSQDSDAITGSLTLQTELSEWEKVAAGWQRAKTMLTSLDVAKREQIETLSQRVTKRLTTEGYTVFGDADLLIVNGVAYIDLEPEKGRASVNQTPIGSLDHAAIADRAIEEVKRLEKLSTQPAALLGHLLNAYEREIRADNLPAGSPIQTTALLLQLTSLRQTSAFRANPALRLFKEYPLELFRADLHALLSSSQHSIKGQRFRYASGADTVGAVFMLVPPLGRSAYVGRVWFEAEAGK